MENQFYNKMILISPHGAYPKRKERTTIVYKYNKKLLVYFMIFNQYYYNDR